MLLTTGNGQFGLPSLLAIMFPVSDGSEVSAVAWISLCSLTLMALMFFCYILPGWFLVLV
jgi:hypothetical protein